MEKKYKKRTTQTKRLRITNKFNDTFLESSSDEDKAIIFITLATVRQN